jgi:hypothetical protein
MFSSTIGKDSNLLFIRKKDDIIIWDDDTLSQYLHYQSTSRVANHDTISCSGCKSPLKDISVDERWACIVSTGFKSSYLCTSCYENSKSSIENFMLQQEEKKMKIPHQLIKVEEQIENHRNYSKMDSLLRDEYEGGKYIEKLEGRKRSDTNKWNRELWYHLYHCKEAPS